MLSRIYEFGRRHRRKVFVASALAGGLVLAGKIAEYKFKSWRDEETRGYLERVRKQHHFESTERTGNLTMVSLFPGLVNKIEQCLDSESVLKEIKDNPQADKISLWNELKIISFSRLIAHVYGSLYLSLLLKVLLNIIGGFMYIQTTSKESLNENLLSTTPSLSARVQEKYLSFCERFVEAGVPELCRLIRDSAAKRVANLSLKEKLNISEIEVIVHDIMDQVKKQEVFQNPAKILLQEDQSGTNELDQDERESLSKLVADALDIFEAPDFKSLIKTAAPVGISKILDVLAEGLSAKVDPTDDLNFLNLNETRLPTAKFIPLMNNILVMSSSDASSSSGGRNPDPILTCFSQLGLIHRFSANVYEAFCQHEDLSSPDSRRPESPPISYTATEFVKSFLPF